MIKIFLLITTIAIQSCSQENNTKYPELEMYNANSPEKGLMTGGQPSIKDLEHMANTGTKVVINLRTKGEFKQFDEKKIVESLGMKYVSIEVAGSKGITRENAMKLNEALNGLKEPALVHCASSNRVGGLLAYRAYLLNGKSAEESLNYGRSAGMSSTEKKVKKLLGL